MTPQRHQRIFDLFTRASELDPPNRAAFLSTECGADAELRDEVESLLSHLGNGTVQALRAPAERDGAASSTATHIQPGQRVHNYTILEVIGHGGMGVVYKAQQVRPMRVVALKVINPGVVDAVMLKRFEQESHVLGRLQHPGIAQIFEAGTFDSGGGAGPQPFFVMEYIEGLPLNKYADAHRLGTRQRLELMRKVCDAVEHAHQKGVIHRDLKPGNILVTTDGQPKILDFGIARVAEGAGSS